MRIFRRGVRTVAAAIVTVLLLTVPALGSATGVITTKADEYNPAANTTYVSWNLWTGRHALIYAKLLSGGTKFRVNAAGTEAYNGSIDPTTSMLTYQQYVPSKGRSDVYQYDLSTKKRSKLGKPVSTDRWEYEPVASGTYVMYGRYYRDADRKIFLFDTSTHAVTTLASTSGRRWSLDPSQVNRNYAVWTKSEVHKHTLVGCNVFLYDIANDTTTRIDNPNAKCQYSPGVNPTGTVYFARSGWGCGKNTVLRQLPLGGAVSTIVTLRDGHDITSLYAVDKGDTTTDVYYDPYRCGHQADIVKVNEP
jgi:Tol biopolymer transport system component